MATRWWTLMMETEKGATWVSRHRSLEAAEQAHAEAQGRQFAWYDRENDRNVPYTQLRLWVEEGRRK